MRHRPFALTVLALVVATATRSLPAQEPAAEAAPSLQWEQLPTMPGLWPKTCQVKSAYQLGDVKVVPGTAYPVVALLADSVQIMLPDGKVRAVSPEGTDCLQQAEAARLALKPGEPVIDCKLLAERADLWPKMVALVHPLVAGEGENKLVRKAGHELHFANFDGTWLRVADPSAKGVSLPVIELWRTDFVERVRAALAAKPANGGHRVLAELAGKLVNLRTGSKTKLNPMAPPQYVVLLFSAGWCPGCQSFAPELTRFYQQHKKDAGKRFEVIWISRDRSEADMKQYAKKHEFPWLAVAWDKLAQIPLTQTHDTGGIPSVVLLDAKGALLADSYVGNEYKGTEPVLARLADLLKSPK